MSNPPASHAIPEISKFKRTLKLDEDLFPVPYTEFQGKIEPPLSLGQPGDIYVDKTAAMIYGRHASLWVKWQNDRNSLIPHPEYPTRFLWCRTGQVGWLKEEVIKKKKNMGEFRAGSRPCDVFSQPIH
jgi:hypothetical protein